MIKQESAEDQECRQKYAQKWAHIKPSHICNTDNMTALAGKQFFLFSCGVDYKNKIAAAMKIDGDTAKRFGKTP